MKESIARRDRRERWFPTIPLTALFLGIGYWAASELIAVNDLQTFKVLNIIGLITDLSGIAILSNFVLRDIRAKRFVLDELAPQISNMFGGVPTGMVAACVYGPGGPSQAAVFEFSLILQLVLAFAPFTFIRFIFTRKTLSQAEIDIELILWEPCSACLDLLLN